MCGRPDTVAPPLLPPETLPSSTYSLRNCNTISCIVATSFRETIVICQESKPFNWNTLKYPSLQESIIIDISSLLPLPPLSLSPSLTSSKEQMIVETAQVQQYKQVVHSNTHTTGTGSPTPLVPIYQKELSCSSQWRGYAPWHAVDSNGWDDVPTYTRGIPYIMSHSLTHSLDQYTDSIGPGLDVKLWHFYRVCHRHGNQ